MACGAGKIEMTHASVIAEVAVLDIEQITKIELIHPDAALVLLPAEVAFP